MKIKMNSNALAAENLKVSGREKKGEASLQNQEKAIAVMDAPMVPDVRVKPRRTRSESGLPKHLGCFLS
jgi:hypothetical protein